MDVDVVGWLNLATRWLHFVAGIAWIGSSFYFIWLDNHLTPPTEKKEGVSGELWAVHGGGFYHNQKYMVAPPNLPADLHWFKWEAYTTWISGFFLLCLIYYYGAETYLIDRSRAELSSPQAIALGLGVLVSGWLIYDRLCKSALARNTTLFGITWFVILTAGAYGLTLIFSDRGAFIHVGAIIGTVMVANVFMVIIPNQRKVVDALTSGKEPDPALGRQAKQRSLHNNYMTLPVLLIMISHHYPQLVGHHLNWLLLSGLGLVGFMIRRFFNLKHVGETRVDLAIASLAGFILIMLTAGIRPESPVPAEMAEPADYSAEFLAVRDIIDRHCVSCHAARPKHDDFNAPPAGLMLTSAPAIKQSATRIYQQAVATDLMPLGNESGMTAEERKRLGDWIHAGARLRAPPASGDMVRK